MTDRLLELAALWGVETGVQIMGWPKGTEDKRPRLDIAHELLAKLPEDMSVRWNGYHKHWTAEWYDGWTTSLTCHIKFEDAVIALAERARGRG